MDGSSLSVLVLARSDPHENDLLVCPIPCFPFL